MLGLFAVAALASPTEVGPAFRIERTTNANEVHYMVFVDEECKPILAEPVRPHWVMYAEDGRREAVLRREVPAYGVLPGQLVDGHRVKLQLRALERPLEIDTAASDGSCSAATFVEIDGSRARLDRVFVDVGWLSIREVVLYGRREDGSPAVEHIR